MPYVVQMHGESGTGKTTLAREIAKVLPGVALELDITSDALIRAGVHPGEDGRVTYEVHYAFAQSLVAMGHNVVVDGPVFRTAVEARSRSLSGIGEWRMIETVCADEDERERRLASRRALAMQATSLGDWRLRSGTELPQAARLVIDTRAPLVECVSQAIAYIRADRPT